MAVRGEGEHLIGCSATDGAGNTSRYYETTLEDRLSAADRRGEGLTGSER